MLKLLITIYFTSLSLSLTIIAIIIDTPILRRIRITVTIISKNYCYN